MDLSSSSIDRASSCGSNETLLSLCGAFLEELQAKFCLKRSTLLQIDRSQSMPCTILLFLPRVWKSKLRHSRWAWCWLFFLVAPSRSTKKKWSRMVVLQHTAGGALQVAMCLLSYSRRPSGELWQS